MSKQSTSEQLRPISLIATLVAYALVGIKSTLARKDKSMKNLLKYSVLAVALLMASPKAHAGGWDWWWPWGPHDNDPPNKPTNAPEVDPSLALGGLTLLAGGLTVVRARRRK